MAHRCRLLGPVHATARAARPRSSVGATERRVAVESALGAEAVVDAMATVADGCGIPLDHFTDEQSAEWRASLGVHEHYSVLFKTYEGSG